MKPKLPSSLSELAGLRAARWIRESRPGQLDNSGPARQRFDGDDAIAERGMQDTGIAWEAGHSGWRDKAIARSAEWADMLSRAGRDYDVLVVAYVSRFCRNLNIGTSIREQLHASGATHLPLCDEKIPAVGSQLGQRWAQLCCGPGL